MTNEEAISRLLTIDGWGEREHEAIAMAIKALEQPDPCEDAVSKQAAIDKIKKRLFETAFNNIGIKQNIDETLADVAENRLENWFNELPSIQPEQRWIPCSERLPEDFKKVLVFWWEHSEPMIDTAFWQKDAKRFDGQHWVRIEDKITHWMPLPEPYQEGEQE